MKFSRILTLLFILVITQNVLAKPIRPRKIRKLLERSNILQGHHVGFVLYDLATRRMLVEQLSNKYFMPASNTKLYTFYAGLKMLKDSVPGLQYIERGDSLIFWGTGDPSFLHPDFTQQPVLAKLRASNKKLFWANGRYTGKFYGMGWPYDDYNDYYQTEITELPLYGNIICLSVKNSNLISSPLLTKNGLFQLITDSTKVKGDFNINRDLTSNIFRQPMVAMSASYNQEVPFKVSPGLINDLLKSNLPNYVSSISYKKPAYLKTLYSVPKDTLFRHMLLPSDNFIAEQFLLTYAAENNLEMNSSVVIDYVVKNFLTDLPDKPQWVDGSGLSRRDLFTPRDMVKLCEKIYDEIGDEKRLFDLLPQGGKTGTLRRLYKSEDKPFVFAKTGTFSNNHNLSGFLVTKTGKRLIFSFMNNNYMRTTSEVRSEMERIITYIHQNY